MNKLKKKISSSVFLVSGCATLEKYYHFQGRLRAKATTAEKKGSLME